MEIEPKKAVLHNFVKHWEIAKDKRTILGLHGSSFSNLMNILKTGFDPGKRNLSPVFGKVSIPGKRNLSPVFGRVIEDLEAIHDMMLVNI
jgi:hypothetical protein